MRRFFLSFRSKTFAAILCASLIPLLACSALMLQIFRLRLTNSAAGQAQEQLERVLLSMDGFFSQLQDAAGALSADQVILSALSGEDGPHTQVYNRLFSASAGLDGNARFDLYDAQGGWRYSTQTAPLQARLSTGWGVLASAVDEGQPLELTPTWETASLSSPLLQAAVRLHSQQGQTVGYLLVSLTQTHLQQLFEGTYGAQNDLLLLSRYWRPVYCLQPSLLSYLAPLLRAELLSGQGLDGISEDFAYSAAFHEASGLYVILQRPEVFTRNTMGLLYTISLSSAAICLLASVGMSFAVSRQLSQPIHRLHQAIDQVEQNNLDVRIPDLGSDELGQLALRFNHMLEALKRNQEQLVANQRELNEAQIRMLQAQLNPHFLCNTLDTMKWISKINKVPQVALMSTNLADILRFCISPDEFVPLWREMEILQRYIEIQRIRLSGSLTFTTQVPEELEDCLIPKMILQPIVENAILHGLDGMCDGVVEIQARESMDRLLLLTVTDNGKGFPADMAGSYSQRDQELLRGHLGLYNVDTILQKYYGEGFGLYLHNRPAGTGASVTAALPLRWEEEILC